MSESLMLKKWLGLTEQERQEVIDFIDFLAGKRVKKVERIENNQKKKRSLGAMKGMIEMHANFDDPIEGFEEYM